MDIKIEVKKLYFLLMDVQLAIEDGCSSQE
jgi:hypothetical protein